MGATGRDFVLGSFFVELSNFVGFVKDVVLNIVELIVRLVILYVVHHNI